MTEGAVDPLEPPRQDARPVFLNPLKVHLPVTATVSLGHRISGLLLVLVLPVVAYMLHRSLAADADLSGWASALRSWPGRFVLLLLTWAAVHHTAAGVRHLLFDAGYGNRYRQARRTAWTVHSIAIAVTLLVLVPMVWGAVR